MIDQEAIERMHNIISSLLNQEQGGDYTQAFLDYCRPLADQKTLKTYIRHKLDTIELGRRSLSGTVILDAGCGFGITCLLFAVMGAKEVHGVDVMETRLDVFKSYLRRLDLRLPVYPKLRSVSALDYPANYFDVVFSNEAISHYRDLPGFFAEMHRVLKARGVLLVSDGNNGTNSSLIEKSKRIWDRFEEGPPGSIGRHKIEKPYVQMRREILLTHFPQLEEKELAALSKGTFGMNSQEILEACGLYVRDGQLPERFYNRTECPLNPATGAVIERFFYPISLAREMSSYGLKAKAYAYFGGAGGNTYVRIANKLLTWLTPLSLRFARGFKIVGVKEA